MFRHPYRGGLTPSENELLRKLRNRGFALVVLPPFEVGGPMNRKPLEDYMLRAGKTAIRHMKEARCST